MCNKKLLTNPTTCIGNEILGRYHVHVAYDDVVDVYLESHNHIPHTHAEQEIFVRFSIFWNVFRAFQTHAYQEELQTPRDNHT